jgi:DNA-binding transcriptional LysR family regulator
MERHAPKIRLDAAYLDERTGKSLESGETDLAMGYAIELHAGVYQQRLLTEHYVCIVRARHPRVDGNLTVQQFLAEAHVAVVVPGTGYSILDKELAANGMQRKVRVRVQSFVALQEIIIATDLLAVVPARLADSMAASRRIRALPIPGNLPSYEVRQYWHERYHRDPGNRWIRQLIFDTFASPAQSGEIAAPG